MITINVPFKKLRRIIHLADIHVRLYKRYEEFKKAFIELDNQLLLDFANHELEGIDSGTVIVVAGDIVHTKTDMSPELVALTSEFLTMLAKRHPTLVIAGNHDLNMANSNRLDALTPIISALNNSNLHYLRESGVYRVADIDFAVFSIIGDKKNWPTPNDCSASTKIALFHGPIHNAETDTGYQVTNRHVTIETFDGFDMVLLGDIHRHQVLQQYYLEETEVEETEVEKYLKAGWERM